MTTSLDGITGTGDDLTIGSSTTLSIPEYCEYHEKLEESNYTFQCIKFRGHKGKHFIIGREIE